MQVVEISANAPVDLRHAWNTEIVRKRMSWADRGKESWGHGRKRRKILDDSGRDYRAREPARYSLFELGIHEVGETRLGVSALPRLCGLRTLVARSRPRCRGTFRRAPLATLIDRSFDGSIVPYTSGFTGRAERPTWDFRWSRCRKFRTTESQGNRAFE